MVFTHEIGHVIGGAVCGAHLQNLDLAPWRLPYSVHSPDPHPKVTLWAGPLLGVLMPLAAAWLLRRPAAWFIADFCLLANGSYLALSCLAGDRLLDGPRLLAAGVSPLTLAAYCLITILVGYARFRADCVKQWTNPEIRPDH